MKRLSLYVLFAGAASLTSAAAAPAGVISEDYEFHWDLADGHEVLPIAITQFDEQGGDRILDSVNISFASNYSALFLVENLEEYAVEAGDWFVDSATMMNFWLGGEAVATLGTAYYGFFTADLAANDGVYMEGPDTAMELYEGEMSGAWQVTAGYLPAFVGTGTADAGIFPWLSIGISPPPPMFDLWLLDHQHWGTLTVTYDYSVVPVPGALALLGLAGLAGTRRRQG